MIPVASPSIYQLFLTDDEQFANLQLWKNLLLRTCRETLWDGEIKRHRLQALGRDDLTQWIESCARSINCHQIQSGTAAQELACEVARQN